ncbi:1-(5-phosphoribosyl)-5-[(5-phosphoribosylamino)methylideneamino]imidazole-4-carboxamide isomerase [Inconstantimicrobium mannanitabidum]|uniref:1-(5-phosphoribosyl)-5-[(5-phosphoribosylamino) methylideneamino] imidazole-4-carboxamide isomerase n=1 Tax=Inconstantimicrobium mannanitabidum TaxID=1604901 RepID=A0ACB5RCG3_9CLOT|nr:1-(5-phosphoribosyl)-5-[(5-phosphoribosylamino)methylideneamino]imidazole-4-carboxamide isomerase [Clostridium sp. TW13]GKX66945.1 1-(5-phosphoribosyl)-5-[(5-phosphoribosylamino) methylideneamino] imidazole-4-carboxamide isomerase [Clostridium sp. TW13]
MIILPAIDIRGGKAVRLYKGDYDKEEVVDSDVVKRAKEFETLGAEYIHIVDLDGAKEGKTVNKELIFEVIKNVNVPIEIGGGIRNFETVKEYVENGVERVILGTAAISNKELLEKSLQAYGDKIAVGIDAKNNMVCGSGWLETSEREYIEFGKELYAMGVRTFIVTDISKDGTLNGVNIEMLKKFKEEVTSNVIASGGIRDIQDINALIKMNIYGAITGKAIYSGKLDLKEAIEASKKGR